MRALIIGGTRNLGPSIAEALLQQGYSVAVFNRGLTPGVGLPEDVERLTGDRSDAGQLRRALSGREFEAVIDTTLYNGPDAEAVARLLSGRVGRYVMLSTGQVYLVREYLERPFREEDYAGPTIPAPPLSDSFNHGNWLYGIEKRAAEDALTEAWERERFPVTVLRLPMVNSERDHFDRIYGYLVRLKDGGPILLPEGPHLPLRHVYGGDAVQAIVRVLKNATAAGRTFNISQNETLQIDAFLQKLAGSAGMPLRVVRAPIERLQQIGLVNTFNFSDPWMSSLDNQRSLSELGMVYTPFEEYLKRLLAYYMAQPWRTPQGYETRSREMALAIELAGAE
jgi:nucleoside-diphosphate-sugar epimerase